MKKYVRSFDVIILGGGVAACTTAITMKKIMPSLKVAVIEQKSKKEILTPSPFRIGQTLSPHAAHTLKQMGIWEAFQEKGFKLSFGTSASWGSGKVRHNEFIHTPFGCGWHLDRTAFDLLMRNQATKRGIRFIYETQLDHFVEKADQWLINVKSITKDFQLCSKFIVDATGKKAAFAMRQGANKHILDRLVGIYRFYKINSEEKRHIEGTFIESDRDGWWYSALLPNDHLALVFMTDNDIANEHRLTKPLAFERLLKRTGFTQTRIEETEAIGLPKLVSAHSQILDRFIGDKWLTVGEATMSCDPLSSLGIFKGLSTNLYAAHAITDHLEGDSSGLAKYEKMMLLEFEDYEENRLAHYSEEKRFEGFPFWQRRRQLRYTPISIQSSKPATMDRIGL